MSGEERGEREERGEHEQSEERGGSGERPGRRRWGPAAGADGAEGGRERRGPHGLPAWPTPVPASRTARMGVYLLLLALGVLTAAAGALVQSGWLPGGLLLALAAAVGLFWGGAKLCRTRTGAAAPGVGWVVTVFVLTSPRPEGDFVFGAGIGSYVFLLGGVLAAVMCATIALPAPPVPGPKYR